MNRNQLDPRAKKDTNHPKALDEILETQINTAVHEYRRSNIKLFISSLSAGLEVGFSVLLMAALHSLFHSEVSASSLHVILALAYPLGFIFVVIGRSELFTEHTTLAVLPVFSGKSTFKSLMALWGIILAGNLIGGFVIALLLVYFTPGMKIITTDAFVYIADHMIHFPWHTIFISAIFAGWLMGLLSWLLASVQDTISRIFVVILVTATIGIIGLHHSIVGSIEVFAGVLASPDISLNHYLVFEVSAIVGNAIGGTVFVGILKFGQRAEG